MAGKGRVYVIGAGFSAALNYPLTHDLLVRLWEERSFLPRKLKSDTQKVMKFFHPSFDPTKSLTFPTVEQLLSEIVVNEDLFLFTRRQEGNFKKADLERVKKGLLRSIGDWFHDLSKNVFETNKPPRWLSEFSSAIKAEKATVISFNWDLILDRLLFGETLGPDKYGLTDAAGPTLLKPHGSLNWFEQSQAMHLSDAKKIGLYPAEGIGETVQIFSKFRSPVSTHDRVYDPLIIPPVFSKNFQKPIFNALWNRCTEQLSTAAEVVFLGYSMPLADIHAQFIFRCGFHNQIEGVPRKHGRDKPTGPSKVMVVNPDQGSAMRIAAIAGPKVEFDWRPMSVQRWIENELHAD